MSEFIVELPDGGAADEFVAKMGMDDCRIYGYRLTGEVVRCRDCKYGEPLLNGMYDCGGWLTTTWDYYNDEPQQNQVPPDGFCKWGERRES